MIGEVMTDAQMGGEQMRMPISLGRGIARYNDSIAFLRKIWRLLRNN